MKLVTIKHQGHRKVGAIPPGADRIWLLEEMLGRPVGGMLSIIPELDAIKKTASFSGEGIAASDVRIEAPIPRPARNIFCVGKNYHEHAQEFTRSGFDSSASVRGRRHPDRADHLHQGAGMRDRRRRRHPSIRRRQRQPRLRGRARRGDRPRRPRHPEGRAYDHVCGYTIVNDVTARDLQGRHKQWFLGKSLDTFCPMGPWLVTADEVDPENLTVKCWVNDELRQDANTRDLIFDIPTLIETISAGMTLLAGDVIATGTPAGVGIGFNAAEVPASPATG